jgi:hypothetical protein
MNLRRVGDPDLGMTPTKSVIVLLLVWCRQV